MPSEKSKKNDWYNVISIECGYQWYSQCSRKKHRVAEQCCGWSSSERLKCMRTHLKQFVTKKPHEDKVKAHVCEPALHHLLAM